MRVLVTNDDGIDSEGIQVLAKHLAAAGHDIMVVAPDGDQSGMGAALGHLRPDSAVEVRPVVVDGLEPGQAWAVAGSPALTVVAAMLGGFGEPPGLVVSGINAGLNTGRSVLHSGTVGAALTGQNFGISGLAVSLEAGDGWQWETAAALAVETVPLVVDAPSRSVVNLNVPARRREDVLGTRWARLAPFGAVRAAVSSSDGDHDLQVELTATDYVPEPDTDQGTVQAGWASLTTIVGIAEAWPEEVPPFAAGGVVEPSVVAGAQLHVAHRVPDASEHRTLRRPGFA